jgi:uncharacterized membrane protein
MNTSSGPPSLDGMSRGTRASAGAHLLLSLLAGIAAGSVAGIAKGWEVAGLVGWIAAAAVFLLWTWVSIWPLDASDTARLSQREDASDPVRDLVLLIVAVGALVSVSMVIFHAHQSGPLKTVLGVACVAASWLVVHTIFTLRYAKLYYADPKGGLDFKQDSDPTFRDFAYVAFTVGMTFQVSDTDVQKPQIRATVLRHALLSFVFGAVIIAVTINLVAGLSK